MANRYVSSAMAGTSVCRKIVDRFGSIPIARWSRTISRQSRRISGARSARVVNACMLAMMK
jgi:hypothetical protein